MKPLNELSLKTFTSELAQTRFPTPAGGAACAACLAMAAGLWEMCCAVSARRAAAPGLWEERAQLARMLRQSSLALIQADTDAYEKVIQASKQRAVRPQDWPLAVREATATLRTMGENALTLLQQMAAVSEETAPSVRGDLVTAAHLSHACLEAACCSIAINGRIAGDPGWEDKMDGLVRDLRAKGPLLRDAIVAKP